MNQSPENDNTTNKLGETYQGNKLELVPLPEDSVQQRMNAEDEQAATPNQGFETTTDTLRTNKENNDKPSLLFPLNVNRKIISIANQLYIKKPGTDKTVGYARQKLLKFIEEIEIFTDSDKTRLLYTIKADRIIDFSAKYHFRSVQKGIIGYTKQHGFKSLFRTKFEVCDDEGTRFLIQQKNPFTEILETLLLLIPVVGYYMNVLSGYFLNPIYEVTTIGGDAVAEMRLKPSFFESKYELRRLTHISNEDQELIIMSLLTVILIQADKDDGGD